MQIFLIAAISVDGFISPAQKETDASTSWTSKEDFLWFQKKTKEAGVCIMGRKTWKTIPEKHRPLKDRKTVVMSNSDLGHSELDSESPELTEAAYFTKLQPKELIEKLSKLGIESIAICGGSSIYTQFVKAGLVNKLYLTVEPKLFGKGVPLFNEEIDIKMKLEKTYQLSDQTIVLEYNL